MRETYRGVRLEARKGREFGCTRLYVNSRAWGEWRGTDMGAHLRSLRGYVDMAGERPEDFDPIFWPDGPTVRTYPDGYDDPSEVACGYW